MKHKKTISHFEKMNINGTDQWVLVKGKNIDAPLLIHVQAGPGLPMISEAKIMEKQLHLENKFLVAYWDQRGCGLSYNKAIPPETMNFTQMADDIIACTKYLLNKYQKSKAVIIGYSIGATISLMAAAKESNIFSVLFAVGTDTDIPYANEYTLNFAMSKAVEGNNQRLIKKITKLKSQPITGAKKFQQRAEILTNLGGIRTGSNYNNLALGAVKNILFSGYYGIGGLIKTMKGMAFGQNTLMPEFNRFNLFQKLTLLPVPVHFIQGKLDAVAPPDKGKEYYEQLQAAHKTFTLFEKSAHLPHYEEPEKFSKLILSLFNG